VTQLAYSNEAVAITCRATVFFRLTVVVSGSHFVSNTYWTECGTSWAPRQCSSTTSVSYSNDATVSPNGGTCLGPKTCTYSIPGGTQVSIVSTGTLSAGGSSFAMTADKTVSVT